MSSCKEDDDQIAPIDQLPPPTQTGAGTFGSLVNGEAFIDNSGSFNCYYQLVNGGYYFGLNGKRDNFFIRQISIGSNNKVIEEGYIYKFGANIHDSVYAECSFQGVGISANTGETMQGELHITKFDFENYVVSGTFWFDLINPTTGETVKIREGRFDSHFTQ